MWGLFRLPFTYLITRFQKATPGGWMPKLWKDLECAKEDLPERFWQATVLQRQDFTELGFTELGFKRVKDVMNPLIRDIGGVNYIDASRRHFGQLVYSRVFMPAPIRAERERITIAFTAVFGQTVFSCVNKKSPFDSAPGIEVLRVQSDDAKGIYQAFVEHLARRNEQSRHFPDESSLQSWFDANATEVFEYRVRTGLFIRMTDAEVAAADGNSRPRCQKLDTTVDTTSFDLS